MHLLKFLVLSFVFLTSFTACNNSDRKNDERFDPVPGGDGCDKEAEY